jgi:hypothetical protein
MKVKTLLYFLLFLQFCGCIKEVDTDFDFNSKIAVFTRINTSAKNNLLCLSNNIAMNDSVDQYYLKYLIKDAVIQVSDDLGHSAVISQLQFNGYYTDSSLFRFNEGRTYALSITTPDGRKASSSMCIPHATTIDAVTSDTASATFDGGSDGNIARTINFSLGFTASENYVHAYVDVFYSIHCKGVGGFDSIFSRADRFLLNAGATQYLQASILSSKATVYYYDKQVVTSRIVFDSIVYSLETDDGTYSKFINSLKKQQAVANDPFAEPSLLYSNIIDGVGVFSAFALRSKKVILPH